MAKVVKVIKPTVMEFKKIVQQLIREVLEERAREEGKRSDVKSRKAKHDEEEAEEEMKSAKGRKFSNDKDED